MLLWAGFECFPNIISPNILEYIRHGRNGLIVTLTTDIPFILLFKLLLLWKQVLTILCTTLKLLLINVKILYSFFLLNNLCFICFLTLYIQVYVPEFVVINIFLKDLSCTYLLINDIFTLCIILLSTHFDNCSLSLCIYVLTKTQTKNNY